MQRPCRRRIRMPREPRLSRKIGPHRRCDVRPGDRDTEGAIRAGPDSRTGRLSRRFVDVLLDVSGHGCVLELVCRMASAKMGRDCSTMSSVAVSEMRKYPGSSMT